MRVFITGATGWVGSAITKNMLEDGHQVVGLVRSAERARELATMGAEPLLGSLADLDVLSKGADGADGVIHTAFGLDPTKIVEISAEERRAIEALGDVLAGSERPLVVTSGFGLFPPGEVYAEDSPPQPIMPNFPRASEQTAFAVAERGVRATVVRLPRSVHGAGERHGFVPMLVRVAREKGVSAYVGEGGNLWPSVHRLDAARVFQLALESGAQGGPFHAVAEEGVEFRRIAEAIGRQVGVPTSSIPPDAAQGHFGPIAMFVAGNGPASSARTRERLGWTPRELDLVSDIDRPEYYA